MRLVHLKNSGVQVEGKGITVKIEKYNDGETLIVEVIPDTNIGYIVTSNVPKSVDNRKYGVLVCVEKGDKNDILQK